MCIDAPKLLNNPIVFSIQTRPFIFVAYLMAISKCKIFQAYCTLLLSLLKVEKSSPLSLAVRIHSNISGKDSPREIPQVLVQTIFFGLVLHLDENPLHLHKNHVFRVKL